MRIFVMGENVWRDENEWPIARTQWTKYFLHSNGQANSLSGNGTLSTAEPASEPSDSYSYDPAKPVTFITDPSFAQIGGPDDYREVEQRADVLFTRAMLLQKTWKCVGLCASIFQPHLLRATPISWQS